jgi:hypothetical protein
MVLDEIANLPDRTGYLWFKSRSKEALRIRTPELVLPHGDELKAVIDPLRNDPTLGARLSRKEYDQKVAARDKEWLAAPLSGTADLSTNLASEYKKKRGAA